MSPSSRSTFFLAVAVGIPLLFLLSVWQLGRRHPRLNWKKRFWAIVCGVTLIPLLGMGGLVFVFLLGNFPFTSGIVAHASAASGEEVCVVQTFKGAEPYQVSLYAHKPGSPWVWHYLAHQDCRWRSCRLEIAEGELRVYEGSLLRKKLTLAEATTVRQDAREELPANYNPEQILQHHNAQYRD